MQFVVLPLQTSKEEMLFSILQNNESYQGKRETYKDMLYEKKKIAK